MPFSLKNAPFTLYHLLNTVFHYVLNKHIIVCLDDVLIYGETDEDHKRFLIDIL